MAKRKSEQELGDRRTYAASEGDGAVGSASWAPAPIAASFARADPSVLEARRIVVPAESRAQPGGAADVRSKKHRRLSYLRGLRALNAEFAQWSRETRVRLDATPAPVVGDRTTPPVFYVKAANEYLRRAAVLRDLYVPVVGDVLTFGNGDMGQLGIPGKGEDLGLASASRPRLVRALRDRDVVGLAGGGLHVAAATEDGAVYTWGCNDEGQLGQFRFEDPDGATADFPGFVQQVDTAYVPARVTGFFPSRSSPTYPAKYVPGTDEAIESVAAGDCHTVCLSTTGNVYMFGCYRDGEGKQFREPTPPDEVRAEREGKLDDFVVARYKHMNRGDDDVEEEAERKRNPKAVKGKQQWPVHVYRMPGKATAIECGFSFNAAILVNGTVVTWGLGDCGELGRPVPVPLKNPKNGKYDLAAVEGQHMRPMPPIFPNPSVKRTVESIGCGGWHLMVVVSEGGPGLAVFSTGLNNYGQLGLGDEKNRNQMTRITALDGLNIHKVTGGIHHSLVLDGSGRNLFAFGRGDYGQLGCTDGQPDPGFQVSEPVAVFLAYKEGTDGEAVEEKEQPKVSHIACGGYHSLALTEDGQLYSWGYGDTMALGHGAQKNEEGEDISAKDVFRPKRVDQTDEKKKKGIPKVGTSGTVVRRIGAGGQFSVVLATTRD